MRKIFYLLFFFPSVLIAQITLPHHSIRAGDKIIKQQIGFIDPGEPGKDKLWDFSKINPEGKEYILEYLDPPSHKDSSFIVMGRDTFQKKDIREGELVMGVEHYTAYYYRIRDNRMTLLGFENPVNLMHYEKPLLMMSYPFGYESKASEAYTGEVVYSGQDPLVTHGAQSIEADAFGRMVLPSGDTLSNVVRVRSVQTIFDDARQRKMASASIATEMETFRWYAEGYRYPVFETLRALNAAKEKKENTFVTAFFYPPQAHHYLEEDPDNLFVQEVQKMRTKDNKQKSALPGNWAIEGTGWGCNFYPNPVETVLNIDYTIDTDKEVMLSLYDGTGRLLRHIPLKKKEKGSYQEVFNCQSMQQGNYVFRLQMGNEERSQIIIKK